MTQTHHEISCKTALSPSKLPGLNYSLNPYRGCSHQCSYCYVPAILRIPIADWHSKIAIKKNIPLILSKELKRKKPGVVGISTVTDPYQPLERKYYLTNLCLKQLLKHDFPISIQTKSQLILTDLPLIAQFSKPEIIVSIATIHDENRKLLEPHASPIPDRMLILKKSAEHGIKTTVFLGPLYPNLTIQDISTMIQTFKDQGVSEIMLDTFHLKPGIWGRITQSLISQPEILNQFNMHLMKKSTEYIQLQQRIQTQCKKNGITYRDAFPKKA